MATKPRHLSEAFTHGSPLKVDREKGVIYGVRVLGSESKNTYGVAGIEATEYAAGAHADACRLYEGITVNVDHVGKGDKKSRSANDSFGVLKNARTLSENGRPVTYADLHYLSTHEMSGRVCEDVEKGLGVFGLSHDAYAGKETVDKRRKRLVIEGLRSANSVDLVWKPATNRNLWESFEEPPVATSLRDLLAAHTPKTPKHAAWVRHLTEDAGMTAALSAEGESLVPAFAAAVSAVAADAGTPLVERQAKVLRLLESQDKILGDAEPDAPAVQTPPPSESADVKQLREELAALKLDQAVRRLCEAESFPGATALQIKALSALPTDADRKALIADLKAAKTAALPRSGFTRNVQEGTGDATPAKDHKEFFARLRA